MVVEAALGAALGVATGPNAHVHAVDELFIGGLGHRVTGEQVTQGLDVYSAMLQSGVEALPHPRRWDA